MPLYEHTFLSRHNLTSQQAVGLADRFAEVITEGGGRLVDQEYWGLRGLAYRIRNNRKAHFCFMRIDAPATAMREMERRMRINEDILRMLTVRVTKHDEGGTSIMKAKTGRDGRRPRRRTDDDSTMGGERHSRRRPFDRDRRSESTHARAENAEEHAGHPHSPPPADASSDAQDDAIPAATSKANPRPEDTLAAPINTIEHARSTPEDQVPTEAGSPPPIPAETNPATAEATTDVNPEAAVIREQPDSVSPGDEALSIGDAAEPASATESGEDK